jgi:hypothetical protein
MFELSDHIQIRERVFLEMRRQLLDRPEVISVDMEPESDAIIVRLRGVSKPSIATWILVRERSTTFETYVAPAPTVDDARPLYDFLLRKNSTMTPLAFSIGAESALYLIARVETSRLDAEVVDTLLGSTHRHSEETFPQIAKLGFGLTA